MKTIAIATTFLTGNLLAGDHVVKTEPFKASISLDVSFLPESPTVIQLEPKEWSQFVVTDVVKHGASVKAGDTLISFEKEDYERALTEAKASLKIQELQLTTTKRELADLEITTKRSLAELQLKNDEAKDALDYFNGTSKALEIEGANESLKGAKRRLEYQQEELKQLLAMYKEDGVTEETEEIILIRQRAAVDGFKYRLKVAEAETKRTIETLIPRKAEQLQRNFDKAALSLATGKVALPNALEQKRINVQKAERAYALASKKFTDLQADSKQLTLKSPADGVVYYGEINDTAWNIGNAAKVLAKNKNAPTKTPLLSLVTNKAKLFTYGSVTQMDRLNIPANAKGTLTVEGLENTEIPATLTNLSATPNASGKYDASIAVDLPTNSPVITGMKGKVALTTYHNENAIVLPKSAISTKDGRSTVTVKLADGKTEIREIKTGQRSNGKVLILSGLEVDQVVILPEPKK